MLLQWKRCDATVNFDTLKFAVALRGCLCSSTAFLLQSMWAVLEVVHFVRLTPFKLFCDMCYYDILDQEVISCRYTHCCSCSCWGYRFRRSPKFCHFKSDRGRVLQDCSPLSDRVSFQIRLRHFKMHHEETWQGCSWSKYAAMTFFTQKSAAT